MCAADPSDQPPAPLEERLSLIVESLDYLDQGVTVIDQDLRLVSCNRRFLELLDFPPAMARPGTHFSEFIRYNVERGEYGPGDPEAQFRDRVERARDFNPHCFERTRPDGTVLEIRGAPMAGKGFVTVYTDITERKRNEAELRDSRDQLEAQVAERTRALRESESRIRLITDAVPVLIAYVGADGRYQFANQRHREWYGLAPGEMIGRTFGRIFNDQVHARLQPYLEQVFAGTTASVELQLPGRGGRLLDLLYTLVPDHDADGRVQGFFALGQDMSEHKRVQSTLARAQRMEALGQLTGGVAHDFNNLLTIIVGNLAFLEDDLRGQDLLEETVRSAMNAARRGSELTNRLLAFSRRQTLKPQLIRPRELVDEVTALLQRSLGETIRLQARVEPGVWPILADPAQLESALLNLALNARDAMAQGGRLSIEVENVDPADDGEDRGHVRIRVSDTGAGMSAEVLEHAFEPFFTTKAVGKGTGLGLSMVYGFVTQSGGEIRIDSAPGAGTRVCLRLPRGSHAEGSPAVGDAAAGFSGIGTRVMLVEDDAEVRRFVRRALEGMGCEVREAADAAGALAELDSDPTADLLITDLVMPGELSGAGLVHEVRARWPRMCVLCMSGYSDRLADGARELGQDCRLLRKPFDTTELARELAAVFAARGSRRPATGNTP